MCMTVWPACMYMHYVHTMPWEVKRAMVFSF